MRLVNVLIERLDLNLKDLTETHDKKLKRTSTIDTTETDDINDETREDEDCDHPIPKKMKLDYFPITMNVSVLVHNIYASYNTKTVSINSFQKDTSVSPSGSGNFNYLFPSSPCSSTSLSPQSTPTRINGKNNGKPKTFKDFLMKVSFRRISRGL